jgi:hypothetical protein
MSGAAPKARGMSDLFSERVSRPGAISSPRGHKIGLEFDVGARLHTSSQLARWRAALAGETGHSLVYLTPDGETFVSDFGL